VSGLSGLLAPSPACFKNSGHINPLPPDTSAVSSPSALTNVGLQVHLNISLASPDPAEYSAILDCAPYDIGGEPPGQSCRAAIRLIELGGNQYARLQSDKIFDIPSFSIDRRADQGYKEVFVRQQPILLLPDIVFMSLETTTTCISADLVTAWPHNQWNPAKRTVRPGGSQREGIVAGFRFSAYYSSEFIYIDVFVGLSKALEGVASWNPWCELHASTVEQPLATVMSLVEARIANLSTKRTELHFGRGSFPEIVFRVSRDFQQGKGQISLTAEQIHEVAASIPRRVRHDPTPGELTRLAAPLTIWESAGVELTNLYSSKYEIRVGGSGGPWSSRQALERIRWIVSTSLTDVSLLRPDQSTPDAFESYFSKLLVKACIRNDPAAVKDLLCSPLSSALIHAWTSDVRATIPGLDPLNLLRGFRPIHWATLFNHMRTVEVLLEHGADIFQEAWTGNTAIHVAIVMGHFEILEQMFAAKFSSNLSSPSASYRICDTIPNFAASFIRSERVAYILDLLAAMMDSEGIESWFGKPNALGETILHRAAATDNIYAARWALQWNPKTLNCRDRWERTPLFHAAAAGSLDVCRLLIDSGASIEAGDDLSRTPLHAACRGGHHQLVHLLFSAKQPLTASVSDDVSFNAWHFAALSGRPEICQMLRPLLSVSELASIRSPGTFTKQDDVVTPLHIASSNGALDCVKVLCDVGFHRKIRSRYTLVSEVSDIAELYVKVEDAETARTAEEWALAKAYFPVVGYLRLQAASCGETPGPLKRRDTGTSIFDEFVDAEG
jgi:ankyrin repeat protein